MTNLILKTDSYKFSHYLQYPPMTEYVSAYAESRSAPQGTEIVHFGLQAFVKEYLLSPVCWKDIDEAKAVASDHGVPFNDYGWKDIMVNHGGYLPIAIEGLLEGTVIPTSIPQVQVVNTDPKHYWLTTYIEMALLRAVWYGSTVATVSREAKKIIKKYLEETSDNVDGLAFKLHDFGARGVSSGESAGLGGAGHLVNFMGTDTIEAVMAVRKYYNHKMAGFSVPAAEHSTITAWGDQNEFDAYYNMVDKFSKSGSLYSVVSDSYDLWNAIDNIWGVELKEKVINSGGKLVIRPDSGIPEKIVPEVLEHLGAAFGSTVNSKGYRMLPSYLGVIQGDGITLESIPIILEAIKHAGWSTDNVVFGMGGGLLQQVNRDTYNYAMKCNAICIEGKWHDVYKKPKTDHGKDSKAGRQRVVKTGIGRNQYSSLPKSSLLNENLLIPIYKDGKLIIDQNFSDIRERAKV